MWGCPLLCKAQTLPGFFLPMDGLGSQVWAAGVWLVSVAGGFAAFVWEGHSLGWDFSLEMALLHLDRKLWDSDPWAVEGRMAHAVE